MAHAEGILIVGGGIAGLTVAAALHQHGFTPELVEHSPAWHAIGAGIAVQPNGMRILRALGLGAAVEQAGTPIRSWDFCDQHGAVLCALDLDALWGDVGPFIGIERTKLHQVLRSGATSVPCRLGTSVAALTHAEDRVTVTFTDGSVGAYDLVVGADGIASTVRALTFRADPPVYAGQLAWRSLVPIRPRGLTTLQFLLGDGCFFGLCPIGEGRTYGFGNTTVPQTYDPLAGRLARLRARFAPFGERIQEYLAALESDAQIHCSAIEWVAQPAWYRGRVVLIGDAGHATSPMMGQGGCLALEDAWVLAEELRAAPSVETALEAYVSRRQGRVGWVQHESRAVAESLRLPVATRNAVLRARGAQLMQARFQPLVDVP